MAASLTASATLCWQWPRDAVPPLATIRRRIASYLSGLGREVTVDVQLVCTELVTNVCEHARTAGQLRITKSAHRGVVRVEVDDRSRKMAVMPAQPSASAKRGRGLVLVNSLAKRWGVRRTGRGKTVWADVETDRPHPRITARRRPRGAGRTEREPRPPLERRARRRVKA